MRPLPFLFLALSLSVPAGAAPPQDAARRKSALKHEIDSLIRRLDGKEFGSVAEAAQWIVALVRSPRRYSLEDGPLMRRPLRRILDGRRSDGLFGASSAAMTVLLENTRWVVQALQDLGAYPELLKETREALAKAAPEGRFLSPWRPADLAKAASIEGGPSIPLLVAKVAAYEVLNRGSRSAKSKNALPFEPFQQKALNWLLSRSKDGVWYMPVPGRGEVPDPGTTALALAAIATKPAAKRASGEVEILRKGWNFLLKNQRPDGSFSESLPNYVTCAAVLALADCPFESVPPALAKARRFLLSIQNLEHRGYRVSDRDYGSIGYGGDRRGDLSNTQMALEALRLTGLPKDDDAIAKALIFIRRCQNLPGEGAWKGTRRADDGKKVVVRPGEDGGAAYYPGNSPAGYDEVSDGTQIARSYGSMTYALLKCYVLSGLPKDDPRLQAALAWASKNWTLETNPGASPALGEKARYQGLYYYYLTLARALSLAEVDRIAGRDWRKELRTVLKARQKDEGFWVNDKNGRWWEASPVLCTAYALLALAQ